MANTYHDDVGVGLRLAHLDYFCQQRPPLSWLEIHSENYFHPSSLERQKLNQLTNDYQLSCHGVGLSLGSVDGIDPIHLQRLKALVDDLQPRFVSDHLSWNEHGGHYFNDLLPLPYTEEALEVFCRNVLRVQEYLGRAILVENPSSYVRYQHSTISEWQFLAEVQRRTDCRLLLDLNNVYVSSHNHGFDCQEYLAALPADCVDEIHLAGFTVKSLPQGEIWIDTHSQPVSTAVWKLYQAWLAKHGRRHTLIEWDLDLPAPDVLLGEAHKASELLFQQCLAKEAS
ncbi:DUF692 domain-containing protein [Vibrio navarrensis]